MIPSILCYVAPSVELLGPTTPRLMPLRQAATRPTIKYIRFENRPTMVCLLNCLCANAHVCLQARRGGHRVRCPGARFRCSGPGEIKLRNKFEVVAMLK